MKPDSSKALNLILIFGASYLVFFNFYASLAVLPLYVMAIGGSEFDAGVQATLYFFSAVIMRFYLGPLADQKGRKLPLMIGTIAFTTAPLLFLLSKDLWVLALARVYHALGLAAFFSSGSSLVADLAPTARRGTYIGAYRLVNTLALLSGPYLALLIFNKSFSSWFIVSTIIGLPAFLMMIFLRTPRAAADPGEGSSLKRVRKVLQNRTLWPGFLGIILLSIGYGSVLNFFSLYASKVNPELNPGLYFTWFSFAGIFANLAAGYLSDRFGRQIVIWPALFLLGISNTLLVFLGELPWMLFASSILGGIGFAGGIATLISWLVDLAEERNRGTVLAIQESAIDFSMSIGTFVFGITSRLLGMSLSYAAVGLLICISVLLLKVLSLKPKATVGPGA